MSLPCCAATSASDRPCAARPLPGSDFCLFHDPARQPALAEGRRKGGTTPRRRARRYPRVLDYQHVAELLSELFVDALNHPTAHDPQRLRALTGLSKVLLQAVGRPRNTYEIHDDRSEPAPDQDCLRRIYPLEPPELAALLAADAEIEAAFAAQEPAPSDSSQPRVPAPVPQPSTLAPQPPASNPDPAAARPGPDPVSGPHHGAEPNEISTDTCPTSHEPYSLATAMLSIDPIALSTVEGSFPVGTGFVAGPAEQDDEQASNRPLTGNPATYPISPAEPGLPLIAGSLQAAPYPDSVAPPGPGPRRCAPPSLRVEDAEATTLSVPGIPILISYRRIPRPFG